MTLVRFSQNTFRTSVMFFCHVRYKTARSCHLSILRMNQTEEGAMKRVFGSIISYDSVVGK